MATDIVQFEEEFLLRAVQSSIGMHEHCLRRAIVSRGA